MPLRIARTSTSIVSLTVFASPVRRRPLQTHRPRKQSGSAEYNFDERLMVLYNPRCCNSIYPREADMSTQKAKNLEKFLRIFAPKNAGCQNVFEKSLYSRF
jgi:hypothetical protein